MKYVILQHDNAQDMEDETQRYMEKGWKLFCGLVSHNGFLHQAMYEEDLTPSPSADQSPD